MDFSTYYDFLLKLTLSIVLGGLIGIERKMSKKAAGFRTMILICMGSALFADIGVLMTTNPALYGRIDVSRMLGHIIAGIGFLGAGTIMKNYSNEIKRIEGLTTAAAIWLVAAVGMLIGLGIYAEAVIATIVAAMVLWIFGKYEITIVGSAKKIRGKISKKKS